MASTARLYASLAATSAWAGRAQASQVLRFGWLALFRGARAVASRVLAYFAAVRGDAPPLFPTLSERERETLGLMVRGKRNAAIAAELYLRPKTEANYVTNIVSKPHVADRAEAMVRAREAGLRREGS